MISRRFHRSAISGFVALLLLGLVGSSFKGEVGSWVDSAVSRGSHLKGRLLLSEEQAAAPQEAEGLFPGGPDWGAASSPLSTEKVQADRTPDTSLDEDSERSDEDDGSLLESSKGVSQAAAAPTRSKVDTGATAPALGIVTNSGVKRHTSLAVAGGPTAGKREEEEEGDLGEDENEGVDTTWNKSLTDTRKADTSVKEDEEFGTDASPNSGSSNGTAGGSNEESTTGGGDWDDDEGGSITSENDPPKLEHRTSSWEGFGDPSKKLTLTVVCSNTGGGVLEVKIATPTWIRADPESVRVGAGEERNISITVLDPKGLKGSSERIQIKSNGGDEYFEITRAALGKTDWTDNLPSSSLSSTAVVAVGSTIVGLAALAWYVCRRRQQRHGASSFKYKELEMQGDLSSALGQHPVGAGMALNSYSSGYGPDRSPRTMTDEESTQGWDDNWDDWDQEEQRSRR
ncbi:hypothetical protein KFL_000620180 [Klebsormidium nitens]|uniref:Uncharacterized protein n=1 Tax=Klebsormidium nitens TaxID=105231 RepID=A0A1Y1HQ72_KLENI|nr:hypothetical protein KFL_000620180 [Klebsormidium nitens]|eukprot:GAQ80784.1 hypothetical protein KFL_000620180 [Klebsormidium nitens]